MEKPIIPPPPPRRQRPAPPPPPPPVVPAATDEDPDSFFSTTSVSSSDSGLSSTPSDVETPSFDPSSKPKASCFGPFRAPKPVRTKPKSTNSDQFEEKSSSSSSASSRAVKIYTQLKSLKQPISPGLKLAKYINSLTSKKKKTKNTNSEQLRSIPGPEMKYYKSEHASPEWSFSSSSLKVNKSSAIAGDSKVGIDQVDANRKVLEEVALDLLNSYWNRRKTENGDDGDKDGDDSSCSSSDLFEIDHLSLIGNEELPVYETTRI